MVRLFIGLKLPGTYRQSITPLLTGLHSLTDASMNWSKPDTWHLTLKFLGDTDEARIPAIRDALSDIEFPAFTMQAGGAGAFPNERQPRVIWLGLEQGAEACTKLVAAFEDGLDGFGVAREQKRFRPHLTLGRVRKPGPGNWQTLLDEAGAHQWPPFIVDGITLWQSDLAPTGAVHTALQDFPLL